METKEKQATIAAPIIVNQAEAKVDATLKTNKAQMEAFKKVSVTGATGYKELKTKLSLATDRQLLDFIKAKTIKTFNK